MLSAKSYGRAKSQKRRHDNWTLYARAFTREATALTGLSPNPRVCSSGRTSNGPSLNVNHLGHAVVAAS